MIKVSVLRDIDKILKVLSLSMLELNYEVIFTYEISREQRAFSPSLKGFAELP